MAAFNLKPRGKEYIDQKGSVRYLDQGNLARPIDMPKAQVGIMAIFLAIGIAIGVFVYTSIDDAVFGSAERKQEAIDANLAREISYDLPILSSLAPLGDDAIRQSFVDAGLSMYEYSDPADYPNGGFMQAHFPSDMNYDEAQALFDQGINSIDEPDAAMLLKGLWTLSVDRAEYLDLRVRYADFASGSLEAAIDGAMSQQGFSPDTLLPENGSGVDEAGNTYKTGTIEIDGKTYQWRVSAVALSSLYSVRGLPDNAVYVGIRLCE